MLPRRLSISFHPEYGAGIARPDGRFPAQKYSCLRAFLQSGPLADRIDWIRPPLASQAVLEGAHDPAYIRAVLGGALSPAEIRRIGFPMSDALVRRARLACGGTLVTADAALRLGRAANAAGGSHHAGYSAGAGFCVFNDVAVAARSLLKSGRVARILILDCDVHQGDGTARLFADAPEVFTVSLHCEANWPLEKPPSDLDIPLAPGAGDAAYISALRHVLEEVLPAVGPDIVFYNAGVDVHADDALGRLRLSDDGLREREERVVSACEQLRIPLACVLGGGYGASPEQVAGRHLLLFEALLA